MKPRLHKIPDTPDIYGIPGNAFDNTTYGGSNAYFTNISFGLNAGTVKFIVPLAAKGGTGYFSLEESISSAYSCPDIINGAVTPTFSGANINATFTPKLGLTLQQAAQYCGFVNFNWVQTKTHINDPTFFSALNLGGAFDPSIQGPVKLSSSRTPYNDPPAGGGYTYNSANPDFSYPFYYNINTELAGQEVGGYTLTFHDAPGEPCLPGGKAVNTAACNFTSEPAGSYEGFTTHLAGVNSDGTATDLQIGFSYTSDYNGTTGGAYSNKSNLPADGNGTGGVTITGVQNTTNYQYNGIVVTTVNGVPVIGVPTDTTPPVITASATPTTIWPPNGIMANVTVSGTIKDNELGGTGINPDTSMYVVKDPYGQAQPTGKITVGSDGHFSFTIQLPASRNGGDKNGRKYIITVTAQDNAGNKGSTAIGVTVPHDQRN